MNYTSPTHYLFLLGFLLLSNALFGQFLSLKSKTSIAKVELLEGKQKGYFHHLDSTSIYLASSKAALRQGNDLLQLPILSINKLKLKKKGTAGRGALIGMVAGGLSGLLIGRATGAKDDCTPTIQNFLGLAILSRPHPCGPSDRGTDGAIRGTLIGAILGSIIGSSKRKFIIGGQKSKVREQEEKIKSYEYKL
jgi:outer membrane lipoprotein SlyB